MKKGSFNLVMSPLFRKVVKLITKYGKGCIRSSYMGQVTFLIKKVERVDKVDIEK